jgi:Protein of unknown function (DUF3300)
MVGKTVRCVKEIVRGWRYIRGVAGGIGFQQLPLAFRVYTKARGEQFGSASAQKETNAMKFEKLLPILILSSLATVAVAQVPIVRQPPDAQPAYPAAPADQGYPPAQQQPAYQTPPPPMGPQQLDGLVNRIALYPDPLLAQTLTAATYWDEIPAAAQWADQHAFLKGDALNQAMVSDNLPWDPSVLALLPFPAVLDMMARDPNWTGTLGNAVLSQRPDVMDAVQRLRHESRGYGYLTSNSDIDVVDDGGYVEIQPYYPGAYYVPIYDPLIAFYPPRPGLFVGGVIRFGPRVDIGPTFARFGWFGAGFGWGNHALLIDHRPWVRTYENRGAYVHPYAHPYVRPAEPQHESHPQPAPQHRDARPEPR